jgi:hypothetical protein
MSDPAQASSLRELPAILIKNRWVQIFAALLALLELYNYGAIPAYITTQKGIETAAIADMAALRQKAEAVLAEWKAITETQIAKYADRKQKAEARKAAADAKIAEAEETIARETAKVSEKRAKAEADAAEGEADIKEQQATVERERAAQARRLSEANAKAKEYEAADLKLQNLDLQKFRQGTWGSNALDNALRRSDGTLPDPCRR